MVAAPLNEKLRPEERTESCLVLSDLVVRMVTHVICHVIVDYEAQLQKAVGGQCVPAAGDVDAPLQP